MTSSTVLGSGDHHFDERSPRWEECLRVHDVVVERVQAIRPAVFCSGGDVFERLSTPTERLHAARFFQAVADVCPVVITRGNHDADRDVKILAALRSRHPIHVVEDARVLEVAGFAIAAMAWPVRAGAIDDGGAREAVRMVLTGLGAELRLVSEDLPRILLGHFDCDGATVGSGQPVIGGSVRVALADLAIVGADAVVMSHIHKAQVFPWQDCPIFFCGSPLRHSYGETEEKSIARLDFDGRKAALTRIPTGARGMLDGVAAWDPDGPGWAWDSEPFGDVTGADCRFSYRVAADQQSVARREASLLKERILSQGAATVKVEPQVEPVVRARAPEVAMAKTVQDKVTAFWAATNTQPPHERAEKLLARIGHLETKQRLEARR